MNELNPDTFLQTISSTDKPVAIMVKASWCSNCKALAPVFEQTAEELDETAKFNYLTVDDNRELAKSLKIMGVPTILFYKHGVLIAKKIGKQSSNRIKKVVEELVDLSASEANDKEYRSFFNKIFGKK